MSKPAFNSEASRCPKCSCQGVVLSHNDSGGTETRWKCWDWQCETVWNTPNISFAEQQLIKAEARIEELEGTIAQLRAQIDRMSAIPNYEPYNR